jgi:hypothetical protein
MSRHRSMIKDTMFDMIIPVLAMAMKTEGTTVAE